MARKKRKDIRVMSNKGDDGTWTAVARHLGDGEERIKTLRTGTTKKEAEGAAYDAALALVERAEGGEGLAPEDRYDERPERPERPTPPDKPTGR